MATEPVMAAAREGEPDRFVAALLAPADVRDDLLALAALCAELRRIPDVVSEPMMGEVRLQWWRDAIAAAPAETGHPIADAVIDAVARHRLPVAAFNAMLEARAFDLYDDPMPDRAAFLGYLEKTEGVPFNLAHRILTGAPAPVAALAAASASYGCVRLLAELPHRLSQRRQHALPPDMLPADVGDREVADRGLFARDLQAVREAHALLRRSARSMSGRERLAFLPTATVSSYLRRMAARGRDPLRQPIELVPVARMVRIAWAHLAGL